MLITILMWGCSFVATKALLRELSPVPLIICRFALGNVFLLVVLAVRGDNLLPPRETWPSLALMGFIGIFIHQLLQVVGLNLTTVVNTGWLIALIPLWSALFSGIFLKERFGGLKLAGLVGGFLGALLIIARGRFHPATLHLPSTRGDILVLLSTANWAIYSIISFSTIKTLGPAKATSGMMLFGWLMVLPIFVIQGGWRELMGVSLVGWAAILFLGIGSSGLGYFLYYSALEKLEVSRVAAFMYAQPLVTLLAAFLLLHESVSLPTMMGGLIVLACVFIVQRAP